jgi:type I restriction enzyme M protein
VLARWQERDDSERERARTEQSFCIPKGEIAVQSYDLSINRFKEVLHELVDHHSPQQILANLARLETTIQTEMQELENMLK